MKWYEYKYINHRDWLLDNLEYLSLETDEIALIMLIDYFTTNHMTINYNIMANKLHKSEKQIDEILTRLVAKKYLKVDVRTNLGFSLKPLFETDFEQVSEIDQNIFDKVEKTFGKLLSEVDANKLMELVKKYPAAEIDKAIEIANLNNKLTIGYIEGILRKNVG